MRTNFTAFEILQDRIFPAVVFGSPISEIVGLVTPLRRAGSLAVNGPNNLFIQNASINGLNVVGHIVTIAAGGSISNVPLKSTPPDAATHPGADAILAGTAAGGASYFGL